MRKKIRRFKNQKGIEKYVVKKFFNKGRVILLSGSTAHLAPKHYSDIDIEVYGAKRYEPYYEVVLLKNYPVLLSVYFYLYRSGNPAEAPPRVKILHGEYNDTIKPSYLRKRYSHKKRIKRECQLVTDFFFKYLRHKKLEDLEAIQKRIN